MRNPTTVEPVAADAVSASETPLATLLRQEVSVRGLRRDGVSVGRVLALSEGGLPIVSLGGGVGGAACIARSVVELGSEHIGLDVVIACEGNDPALPIVLGCLGRPSLAGARASPNVEVEADGARVVVSAERELVLRCGRARITLTSDGRVEIEGAHVSSRATGTNRLKGGSIQLN